MQTPEKKIEGTTRLFKMFSINGENVQPTPIAALRTESKAPPKKLTQDSVRTVDSQKGAGRASVLRSSQNQEVEVQLADFKKYLHKSSIMQREAQVKVESRPHSKCNAERQLMKDRLEQKIQKAHQKLEEIKSTLRKYQEQKSEIMSKSDMRRSSIHSKTPSVFSAHN